MIESLAELAEPVLNIDFIQRTRRNHGLEHATVHVLSSKIKNLSIAGRSDASGFWLMGDVDTDQVRDSVDEALHRMQGGESQLAIHPNCGTGLVTTGIMASMAGLIGSIGIKRGATDYVGRLPTVMLLTIGAIILSQPLGLSLQEHFTTLGDPGNLRVLDIERDTTTGIMGGTITLHRVNTTSS
ncbi:MAG: DUF6391 domain-containing protein [Chloroflexota bacterium]